MHALLAVLPCHLCCPAGCAASLAVPPRWLSHHTTQWPVAVPQSFCGLQCSLTHLRVVPCLPCVEG